MARSTRPGSTASCVRLWRGLGSSIALNLFTKQPHSAISKAGWQLENCGLGTKTLPPRKPWFPTTSPPVINWSTDCKLDRLADPAEHFHERIDGELGRFLVHHVGHARARDHQNLGGIGLLQVMFRNQTDSSSISSCFSSRVSLICLRDAACRRLASSGVKPSSRKLHFFSFLALTTAR